MTLPGMSDLPEGKQASDRDLVTRLQAGQAEALGPIYDRYASLVYTLALKMMAHTQEAEDLTQEVFVSLWQRQNYDPNRGSLRSYLATFTRSRALDRLRVSSNRRRILRRFQRTESAAVTAATPTDVAAHDERSQTLKAALQQLPETEREVLNIAYFEGYSQSQIAQRLGIPLGTVKTRSRQGLIRLRQLLDAHRFD